MLAGNHHVDVIPAAQAVIKNRQQAVCIRRQITTNDTGLLIDHMVEKTGVLVREPVMVLLPDVRGKQIVQRRNLPAPGQFGCHLQPLGVLAEHRIHDANECFIAVE